MSDPATLAYYERAAPRYTASNAQMQARWLDPFLGRLPHGASILELGCGTGRDAAHMLQRGHCVDATDGAAAMVRKANERHAVDARQMAFAELDEADRYDAVWAHASLLHLPRADLPFVLASIHRALKPGGLHFANYKLGDTDHPEEGRDLLGRWTSLPSQEWLEDRYTEAGFTIVEAIRYTGAGCDGTQRDWLALTLAKPAP